MRERDIEAVIFDCDGVLVDSETLACDAFISAVALAGVIYDRHEFMARFNGMPDAAFYPALRADVASRGRTLPIGFEHEMEARLDAEIRSRVTEVSGARQAVQTCPFKKAVASSSGEVILHFKLEKVGLWDAFVPHVYSGEQVERGKPAPDLFLHAAEGLGVAASRCIVLEDSVNGVRAGRAAGMTVWGFVGGGHCSEASAARLRNAGAHRVLDDWMDFTTAVGQVVNGEMLDS